MGSVGSNSSSGIGKEVISVRDQLDAGGVAKTMNAEVAEMYRANQNPNARFEVSQNGNEYIITRQSETSRENLGYNEKRMRNINIENIRSQSENRRIVEQAKRDEAGGNRAWKPEAGQRISNISHPRAQLEVFNAPVGTVITMSRHNTGDYIGEYTRTAEGWVGSQRYKSSFRTPPTIKTPNGFAMQVSGNDIEVLEAGKKSRRKKK